MTNVLIVEDERLVSEMLIQYINSAPNRYQLVETIQNADNAILVCYRKKVDLILMDICAAQNTSGLKAANAIKVQFPNIKIIIITSAPEYRFIKMAHQANVESFWYKDIGETSLLTVMDQTMAGASIYPEQTPNVNMGYCDSYNFTPREMETLYWLVKVGSAKEIAEKMNVKIGTVQTYLNNLKNKTGCNSKSELAILAVENKLVLPKY